jgi:hypothetical protein
MKNIDVLLREVDFLVRRCLRNRGWVLVREGEENSA